MAELQARLEAELARLGKDAAGGSAKVAAGAPKGAGGAVFDLGAIVIDPDGPPDGHGGGELPPTGMTLSWTERLIGDYDMNGLVGLPDLVPISAKWAMRASYDSPALHGGFGSWPTGDPDDSSGSAAGPGATNWRVARVDGDGNGLISLGDITPIAAHWKESLSGYLIEHAVNRGAGVLEWDAQPLDLGSGRFPSVARSIAFPAGSTSPDPSRPVRYSVEAPLSDAQYAQSWRVRAYDSASDTRGEPSNLVSYVPDPTHDTTPPVWVNTVGVSGLLPYHAQITVQFGVAEDAETPPVSYRVYWAQGDAAQPDAPFDYATAQYADVAAAPYVITGLTDGLYYRVAVRAADSADPPNREQNGVLLGAAPGSDVYPPVWQSSEGITDLYYGDGEAIVAWGTAVDSHTEGPITWESGPVVYRVYYGEGETPDWATAQYAEFTDNGQDGYVTKLTGFDTTKTRWFAVRARDQAALPNEDANTAIQIGYGLVFSGVPYPPLGPGVPPTADPSWSALVYGARSDQLSYVLLGRDGKEVWLSRYSLEQHDWKHQIDTKLTTYQDEFYIPEYTLDGAGKLRVLYARDNTMAQNRICYYREDTGANTTYEMRPYEEAHGEGFTLDGTPWFVPFHWNGQMPGYTLEETFYFWPPQPTNPFWVVGQSNGFKTLTIDGDYAMLISGAVVVRGHSDAAYLVTASRSSGVQLELYNPPTPETTLLAVGGRAVDSPILVEEVTEETDPMYGGRYSYNIKADSSAREVRPPPTLWLHIDASDVVAVSMDCMVLNGWLWSENWIPGDGSSDWFNAAFVFFGGKEYKILNTRGNQITRSGMLVCDAPQGIQIAQLRP